MGLVKCARCREREDIATHQFVKFDTEVRYLCRRCWLDFRRWFNRGAKLNDPELGAAA